MRGNILAQTRSELYAREYARHQASPLNHWLDKPIQDRREGGANTRAVIERYVRDGIFVAPEAYQDDMPETAGRRASV